MNIQCDYGGTGKCFYVEVFFYGTPEIADYKHNAKKSDLWDYEQTESVGLDYALDYLLKNENTKQ